MELINDSDRLRWLKRDIRAWCLIITLIVCAVIGQVVFVNRGKQVIGEGTINVFPNDKEVKNYRLTAFIESTVIANGWFSNTERYAISSARWPNGGTLEFNDVCEVNKGKSVKCKAGDKEYTIEVQSGPSEEPEPSPDYYDPYY